MPSEYRNSGCFEKDELTPKPLRIRKRLSPTYEEQDITAALSTSITNARSTALVRYSGTPTARHSSLIALIDEMCALTRDGDPDNNFGENPTFSMKPVPAQPGPATLNVRKTRRGTTTSRSGTERIASEVPDNSNSAAHCTTLIPDQDTRNGHSKFAAAGYIH